MPDLKRLLLSLRCIRVGFALLGLGAGSAQAEGFAGLEILPEPVMREDSPALLNAEGTAVPLSGAPVTVLNFWATWCAPCVAEVPTLIALDEALGDRGLRVVAASLDRSFEQIEGFWQQQGWGDALEVGLDERGALFRSFSSDALGARGVPYTAILDAEGAVVSWFVGDTDWAGEAALAYFNGLLDAAE